MASVTRGSGATMGVPGTIQLRNEVRYADILPTIVGWRADYNRWGGLMTNRSRMANRRRNSIARILGQPPGRWRIRTDKRPLDPTSRWDITVGYGQTGTIEGSELRRNE